MVTLMPISIDEFKNQVALHLEVVSGTESVPADMSADIQVKLNASLAYLARTEQFYEPDPTNTIRDEAILGLVPYVADKCYSVLQSPRVRQEVMAESQQGLKSLRRLTDPSYDDPNPNSITYM